jgi:hypothetical protein
MRIHTDLVEYEFETLDTNTTATAPGKKTNQPYDTNDQSHSAFISFLGLFDHLKTDTATFLFLYLNHHYSRLWAACHCKKSLRKF